MKKNGFLAAMLGMVLTFGFNDTVSSLPWEEEVYQNAPAPIRYGVWLNSNSDIDSMRRILLTFAEVYKNIEISYQEEDGDIFNPVGTFKYTGNNYWYIWDAQTFAIHKGNKSMVISFRDTVAAPNRREDFGVLGKKLADALDAFFK